MMLTFCKSQLKNLLVNYSNNLQVNVSSLNSLRERDWEALTSLFDRDDSNEIEDEIKSKLVWLVPEPCWADNPCEFAYIAEIVRGGIQSIEIGQSEAAKSLGLKPVQTMTYVIFPQALRRMIPPLGNEFISLLKDTSLVAVIGFEELFRKGQLIVSENYRAFEVYAAVAVIYLCLTLICSQLFSRLEIWMNPMSK
jgi:hypothetical protein